MPIKKTYRNAYDKLSNEAYYETFERYKKYLNHKMNAINGIRDLETMMSEDSNFWGGHKADEIIHAHRIKTIDDAHFQNPAVRLSDPENQNALITEMVKPFEEMVKTIFRPMQRQYGSPESLKSMHEFIDKILFDENLSGGDAHNKFRNTEIVQAMSNEVEINLIVKYLVQNTKFFGCTEFNNQLYHGVVKFKDGDLELGSCPDDAPTRSLVSALLIRIGKTDNEELKQTLGLDINPPRDSMFYMHPLLSYWITNTGKSCAQYCSPTSHYSTFEVRKNMVKSIINHYYNEDINERLQKVVIQFAKSRGIHLSSSNSHEYDDKNIAKQHWLSDTDTNALVKKSIEPFIERLNKTKQDQQFFGKVGLQYFKNTQLLSESVNARYIELKEVKHDSNSESSKKKPIKLRDL